MAPKVYFPLNWGPAFCLTSGLKGWWWSPVSRKNWSDSLSNLLYFYPNLMNYKVRNEINLIKVSLNLDC
jgi:hypothetical protein